MSTDITHLTRAVAICLLFAVRPLFAQNDVCDGGAIKTHEAYLYGRFETRMQSTPGDGVVSSFFLYNWDLACNYPENLNEIDIEMTGNQDNSVQFTTHHPFHASQSQIFPTPFNPHTTMVDYAIEWTPGTVRWFINGELAHLFSNPLIATLEHPMRIFMNLWVADAETWTGLFDPAAIPGTSRYDYVRYYSYTPGAGTTGTDSNFTLAWEDPFDTLDLTRWQVDEGGHVGPLCTFRAANVDVTPAGELELHLTNPSTDIETATVQFAVDASALNLGPSDVVCLNGGFNNWCGNCTPMTSAGNGVWTLALDLPLGDHEYQFAVNGWGGAIGAPAQGSSCDFQPCDEWLNYGFNLQPGAGTHTEPMYCWSTCENCAAAGCYADLNQNQTVDITDLLLLLSEFGCLTNCSADLTGDGLVTVSDLLALIAAHGTDCG